MRLEDPVKNLDLSKYPYGNVFQYYGESPELYRSRLGYEGHNGIDIVTHENDEIICGCDGIVLKVDVGETSFGKGVWVLSKPYFEDNKERAVLIVYFHLKTIYVNTGQEITKGKVIGLEGNTGFVISGSTPYWGDAPAGKGVHLHFGVYPLVRAENKDRAYIIDEQRFAKEYPENGYNGAVNPLPYLRGVEIVEALSIIEKARRIIKMVVSFIKKKLL